jgi:hypothetical protein
MAKATFTGRYKRVEKPAATCIPALDGVPPSVLVPDEGTVPS